MGKIIGIDLGTSNSAASVLVGGKPTTIPSAEGASQYGKSFPSYVAFTEDGQMLVGEPARRQAVTNPENTISAIKRSMGTDHKVTVNGKQYSPQEISAFILQKIKKDADGIIQELDRIYRGSDERSIPRYSSSLIDENSDLNRDIRTVFSTFSTHEEKEDGKVTSSAESLYDEMVDCLSKTEGTKPIMAISSPFYLSHYFEKRNTYNIKALDIGCKNWFYAKGEHDFFKSFSKKSFIWNNFF